MSDKCPKSGTFRDYKWHATIQSNSELWSVEAHGILAGNVPYDAIAIVGYQLAERAWLNTRVAELEAKLAGAMGAMSQASEVFTDEQWLALIGGTNKPRQSPARLAVKRAWKYWEGKFAELQTNYAELASAVMGSEPIEDHACNVSIAEDGARALECSGDTLKRIDKIAELQAVVDKLVEACKGLLLISRTTQPRKFDEAVTWRENDLLVRRLADDAIAEAAKEKPDADQPDQ